MIFIALLSLVAGFCLGRLAGRKKQGAKRPQSLRPAERIADYGSFFSYDGTEQE